MPFVFYPNILCKGMQAHILNVFVWCRIEQYVCLEKLFCDCLCDCVYPPSLSQHVDHNVKRCPYIALSRVGDVFQTQHGAYVKALLRSSRH